MGIVGWEGIGGGLERDWMGIGEGLEGDWRRGSEFRRSEWTVGPDAAIEVCRSGRR